MKWVLIILNGETFVDVDVSSSTGIGTTMQVWLN